MKAKFIPLLMSLLSAILFANEIQDTNSTLYLDEITISALKNPAEVIESPTSIYVLNNEQFKEEIDGSIYDVLEDIPNLSLSNTYFGFGRIAIRGATGPQIILRVDGVRQNFTSQSGNARSALMVDPDTLDSVEVLLGQSSSLYGSGAIGGVISMETKSAKDMLKKGKIVGAQAKYIYHDSNKLNGQVYSAYANLLDEKVDLIVQHSIKKYGRIEYADGSESRRDLKDTSTFFKSNIKLNDENDVTISFKRYLDELENGRGGYETRQNQYSLQYKYKPTDNKYVDLFTNVYYLDRKDQFGVLNRRDNTISMKHDKFTTFGLDIQNASTLNIFGHFTYGLEYYKDEQKSKPKDGAIDFRPDGEGDNLALFVQDEVFFTDDFKAIPSMRLTKYKRHSNASVKSKFHEDQSDTDFSPSLTLQYFINENFNIFGTYGKSFRAPTIDEMYVYGTGDTPPPLIGRVPYDHWVVKPNTSLKSETSWGWQGGFGYKKRGLFTNSDILYFKTTLFYQDIEDMIVLSGGEIDPATKTLYTTHYNVNKANKKGLEVEAEYMLNPLSVGLGYSKIKSKDKESNEPIYSAMQPDVIRAKISYKIKPWYLKVWLKTNIYRKFQASKSSVPSYALHDLGISFNPKGRLEGLEVYLGVDNVLDKKYEVYSFTGESFGYGIGRNYKISFSYKF